MTTHPSSIGTGLEENEPKRAIVDQWWGKRLQCRDALSKGLVRLAINLGGCAYSGRYMTVIGIMASRRRSQTDRRQLWKLRVTTRAM